MQVKNCQIIWLTYLKDQAIVYRLKIKTVFFSCFSGTASHLPSQTEIWGDRKL
jgi:hypothetical protein